MKKIVFFIILCWIQIAVKAQDGVNNSKSVPVNIRILDAETNTIIPVMACIISIKDHQVRIPPEGDVLDSVSETKLFFKGVENDGNKNWIGPVRKMNGLGNNEDRSYVYEDTPSLPYWTEPVLYQTSGNFTTKLEPGQYRIKLEHGNEYIPLNEIFYIPNNKSGTTRTFKMERWIDLPELGWYSGDVHIHHPTNKPGFRRFLLEYAKAEDVHVANILAMGDHFNEETDFKQEGFGEKFRISDGAYWLVSGQEDPRSIFGHIIGLNIDQLVRDTSTYDYYDLAFQRLHEQPGAIVGYAHFAWRGSDMLKGLPWLITTDEIDFVELLQFSQLNTIDYYDYLNLGFRITAAAGSDFPWGSTIGEVRTFVYTGDNFNASLWFNSLKEGHTFVSNGPALFLEADGKLPGSEIFMSRGETSKIKVSALSHPSIGKIKRLAIYNSDGIVANKINEIQVDSVSIELEYTVEKSQWLSAVVYCENDAVAHTSPLYFIVDGKPTWSLKKAPEIIEKQLRLISSVKEETLQKKKVDQGILDRLEKAKAFYNNILEQIKK